MLYNVDKRVLTGRWQEPGDITKFKRLGTFCKEQPDGSCFGSFQQKTRPTTRFVQDLNQLTIAAVHLYYDFQPNILSKLGLQRLKIGFNMNNVATFSSIKIERGLNYPFARRFTFSIETRF